MPIYMIQVSDRPYVKIGFSENPPRRLSKIQACHVDRVSIIRLLHGSWSDEYELHQRFADLHVRCEWYQRSEEMLGDIGLDDLSIPVIPEAIERSPVQARAARNKAIREKWSDPASGLRNRKRTSSPGSIRMTLPGQWSPPLTRTAIAALLRSAGA
jgi:hypothetical protein